MNVRVAIGSSARWWRPLDAPRLGEWLSGRPWEGGARPFVVKSAKNPEIDLPSAILTEVRGAGYGADDVAVNHVATTAVGPVLGLGEWMGVHCASSRDAAEALARLGTRVPRLLVVSVPEGVDAAVWVGEIERVVDLVSKLPSPGQVAFLVATVALSVPAEAARMDVAWPAEAVRCDEMLELWAGYLHERVAWHTAGQLDLALELANELASLLAEDDARLEHALDLHAVRLFDALPVALKTGLRREIKLVTQHPELQLPAGLCGPESRFVRVAPWLARALLAREPAHPARRQLQAGVICRPLAGRLFGRCLDLEQRVHDWMLPNYPLSGPNDESRDLFRRLRMEHGAVEHRVTPRGVREAEDPWDFASLHDVISLSPGNDRRRPKMHELRLVRNALAHGTPVGWQAISIVEGLEVSLR